MGYVLDYVYPSKAKAIAEARDKFRKEAGKETSRSCSI